MFPFRNVVIVSVPPDILDYPTSTDMEVREGSNVTLRCAATGTPKPTVTWRREAGGTITLSNWHEGRYLFSPKGLWPPPSVTFHPIYRSSPTYRHFSLSLLVFFSSLYTSARLLPATCYRRFPLHTLRIFLVHLLSSVPIERFDFPNNNAIY